MTDEPLAHYPLFVPWWKRSQKREIRFTVTTKAGKRRAQRNSSASRMAKRFAERMG